MRQSLNPVHESLRSAQGVLRIPRNKPFEFCLPHWQGSVSDAC